MSDTPIARTVTGPVPIVRCPRCGRAQPAKVRIEGELAYLCMSLQCGYVWWEDGEPRQPRDEGASID